MRSKKSVEPPPEFLFDRSLGKVTASRFSELGYTVHRVSTIFENDGQLTADDEWIEYGRSRGWIMVSKDQNIRFRANEIQALRDDGLIFCLARQDWCLADMTEILHLALPRMLAVFQDKSTGFWTVYRDGAIRRRWPS